MLADISQNELFRLLLRPIIDIKNDVAEIVNGRDIIRSSVHLLFVVLAFGAGSALPLALPSSYGAWLGGFAKQLSLPSWLGDYVLNIYASALLVSTPVTIVTTFLMRGITNLAYGDPDYFITKFDIKRISGKIRLAMADDPTFANISDEELLSIIQVFHDWIVQKIRAPGKDTLLSAERLIHTRKMLLKGQIDPDVIEIFGKMKQEQLANSVDLGKIIKILSNGANQNDVPEVKIDIEKIKGLEKIKLEHEASLKQHQDFLKQFNNKNAELEKRLLNADKGLHDALKVEQDKIVKKKQEIEGLILESIKKLEADKDGKEIELHNLENGGVFKKYFDELNASINNSLESLQQKIDLKNEVKIDMDELLKQNELLEKSSKLINIELESVNEAFGANGTNNGGEVKKPRHFLPRAGEIWSKLGSKKSNDGGVVNGGELKKDGDKQNLNEIIIELPRNSNAIKEESGRSDKTNAELVKDPVTTKSERGVLDIIAKPKPKY